MSSSILVINGEIYFGGTFMSLTENENQVIYQPAEQEQAANRQKSSIQAVDDIVRRYYPSLVGTVHAALAVIGAMALKGRTKPLSLIFETASGYGKTASLQMTFP